MKKLPIGIQTLNKIVGKGYAYVDKTEIALRIISQGEYYFLFRPRRFEGGQRNGKRVGELVQNLDVLGGLKVA